MKNNLSFFVLLIVCTPILFLSGCSLYSFSGAATAAKTIQVDNFFNNTDLAPANVAQDFTNKVKDYYIQNSSLRVVPEGGELQIDGVVTRYDLAPLATVPTNSPTSTTTPGSAATPNNQQIFIASQTRLTIVVKVNYVDNTEPKNSFKDKAFTFYQDFDATKDFSTLQADLQTAIFNQILIDIFNSTVANW